MDEDYIITWTCIEEGTLHLFKIQHMNPGKSNNPSTISHFDKPMKTRWRIRVKEDFKSWRQLLSAKGSATQYLWNCTFAFCSASSFLLSASEAISPSISPLGHNREWCAAQQTDGETERETHRQITRQIDQEVVELSMQRITAATTCDHRGNERQGDRARVTEGKKQKNRWGGREEEV